MAKRAVVPSADLVSSVVEARLGLGLISPADRWLDANPYLCGLLGYSREDLVALDRAATTHPEDLAEETSQLDAMRRGTTKSVQIGQRYRTRHGDFVWVNVIGIINDILKFAKLESGQIEMTIEEFPIDAALARAEELVRPQLDAKRIKYRYVKGDKTVTVRSDRERFQQIVLNLLANSVKFTPEGGAITVSWEEKGEQVLTHVADTGIGIAADQIERIFDPFVQVDASTTRS